LTRLHTYLVDVFFPANNILQVDSCRLPEPAFGRYSLDIHMPLQLSTLNLTHNTISALTLGQTVVIKLPTDGLRRVGRSTAAKSISCMIRSSARTSISVSSGRVQRGQTWYFHFRLFSKGHRNYNVELWFQGPPHLGAQKKNYR